MSNLWLDDGQQQQDAWYAQGQGASQPNMSWGQFDYSQQQDANQQYSSNQNYYQQQNPYGQSQNFYGGQMFVPSAGVGGTVGGDGEDFENEPPLLEELGINFSHIKEKTFAVLNPASSASPEVIEDQDLAGPLVFCLLFGFALLLHGKMTFGYIYGIGGLGCVGMYALMNLMAAEKTISFTCTASVLGYCLLPMALLSLVTAVLSFKKRFTLFPERIVYLRYSLSLLSLATCAATHYSVPANVVGVQVLLQLGRGSGASYCGRYFAKGPLGYSVSALAVIWCSSASSKLFVIALSMDHQRLLVAYPCVLLYSVFALLAIF